MRNTTISISSDSGDEDNIPLKQIVKLNGCAGDPNAYDTLRKHSVQACEFCDRISDNRYSSLIHNIKHIIIPLLKQTVYHCPVCLHCFTSQKEMKIHTVKKHPELARAETSLDNDYHSLKELKPTALERNVITLGTKKVESKQESIVNRLVFEDDDLIILGNSEQLLSDLTTDCKVNLEVFDTPWLNGERDEFSGRSVHYDELMKPGFYRCKKCGKGFPVRYDVIVHESSHIKIKNSEVSLCVICKKYLVGGRIDLRHHYLTYHRDKLEKNVPKHTEEYIPKLLFEENEEKKLVDSKILSLCDLCFSFCRNKSTMNYEYVETISKMGKRYTCEKCGQLFFEINLVKRSLQRRAIYGSQSQKKRKKTNEDRLKTIAYRFKMMKH